MYPCEVCHTKLKGLCIHLQLVFNSLQMKIFARVFYLLCTSGLFLYYLETTTSLIYKKKLIHLLLPKPLEALLVTEPDWLRQTDPLCNERCLCYVEDPVLSRTVHLASLAHKKLNSSSFLGWNTSLMKLLLQSWKYIAQEEAEKEKRQPEKAACPFSCTQDQTSKEPASTDTTLRINGSLRAENKPSTILFFIKQFRRFAPNSFHSNPGL